MEQERKRRFSLEDDFMKSRTDDLLFGFMRCLSTAMPVKDDKGKPADDWKEYLPVSKYREEKRTAANLCGCTTRTIDNKVKKLIAAGLVEEGSYTVANEQGKEYTYPCYFFPYDYDMNFKLLSKEMVKHLVYTRNINAIRIYIYLLNKAGMKKDYNFTIDEIKLALGYAPSTKTANEIISHVLASFKAEGLIDYEKKWFDIGTKNKIEKFVLKFVATVPPQV